MSDKQYWDYSKSDADTSKPLREKRPFVLDGFDESDSKASSEASASATNRPMRAKKANKKDNVEARTIASLRQAVAILGALCASAALMAIIFATLSTTSQIPAGVAAKTESFSIYEEDVASYISRYRKVNSYEDDESFASALLAQGDNVFTFRQSVINQFVLAEIIDAKAEELGVSPTDDEVQAQIDLAKQEYAFGSDEVWEKVLSDFEMSEDELYEQYETALAQEAVLQAEVSQDDATDEEVLVYIQENLAGTTQKHAWRIVITGSDKESRAERYMLELQEAAVSGHMTTEIFSDAAKRFSDEEGVSVTEGSYAWSGELMSDEVQELVAGLSPGEYTGAVEIQEDNALEIIFCDEEYTFADAASLTEIPSDIPESLLADIESAAAEDAWSTNCDYYLTKLLADAKITYYPMPDDAQYNVDMSLAGNL